MGKPRAMIEVLFRLFQRRTLIHPPAPLRVLALMACVLAYGTTGFLYFELPENPDLGWADGLWYSVVTVTTVGYGDLFPKSMGGRYVVAVPLMFFGIGLLGYVLSIAASALVEARSKELKGMAQHAFKDHLVLFNFPSIAKVERVLDELTSDPDFGERKVVLVDETLEELPPELLRRGLAFVRGNPTRDETLSRASVDSAAYAVILCKLPGDQRSDEKNVAITLALEARAKSVFTVVECVDHSAEELLKKAGSDAIVCTSRFDAYFLSHELMNPGVQEVVGQLMTNLEGQQIYVTRYRGEKGTTFEKLAERCRAEGHMAIGIRTADGPQINVSADARVTQGDGLITIGPARLGALS
jgi:voltage-gated potassium channel